jgi:hypothetical protein
VQFYDDVLAHRQVKPVPSPEGLVVKNGLNILSSVAQKPALARDSGGLLIGFCPSSPSAHYWGMANDQPFMIEILDLGRGEPVVVDRVTGATVYMEEAKRTGRHLLSLTGLEVGCGGIKF